jgi:methylated-DNA-[protein]-cysteine S-methyltransferase
MQTEPVQHIILPSPFSGFFIEVIFTDQAVLEIKWHKRENLPEELGGRKSGKIVDQIIHEFSEYWDGRRKVFTIPYRFNKGTHFQHNVWRQIASIPYGSTISYGKLSLMVMGTTSAARAVGQACARNPLPILIPCHRVVKGDGTPGYYSAPDGAYLKTKLIEFERKNKVAFL